MSALPNYEEPTEEKFDATLRIQQLIKLKDEIKRLDDEHEIGRAHV